VVWLARVNFDDSHGDASVEKPPAKLDSEIPEVVKQERLRISRELHDRVLQSLATVKMRAETCRQQLLDNRKAVEVELQNIEDNVDKAITEIRNLLTENQSTEDLQAGSLERRLKQELEIFCARSGFKLDFCCSIGADKLPRDVEKELYFMLREGILNAVRHSRATELHLSLRRTPEGCEAALRDNGVGYDPTQTEGTSHYGLKGMRERVSKVGGDISVTTAPNQGTEINITVPFEAE
jgi:NarL family two-component system sensor histidine kinase LiaS